MLRKWTLLAGMIVMGLPSFAQKVEDVLAYIAAYKDIAMAEMKRTGIPAAIKLAQGIHETEAGKSDLVQKSNNHFGIKCKATWTGDKVFHDDDARGECFRSYSKAEDSYMDHSDFLKGNPRYAFLFNLDPTDYEGWAYGLKKAGYATNIRYPEILIKLIQKYNLEDYSLIALGRMNEADHALVAGGTSLPSQIFSGFAKQTAAAPKEEAPAPNYPAGEFTLNETKVVWAAPNTSWLAIAEKYHIPLSRLWDYNDLEKDDEVLAKGQLVFLQRKKKTGATPYHTVQKGEDLYGICQAEGIRFENLLDFNRLSETAQPATGEKLYLQSPALVKASTEEPAAVKPSADNTLVVKGPEPTRHLVAGNETLYSIAKAYGVDVLKIKEWNKLDSLTVKQGQSLIIYKAN
ncbi:MAG: LysM peptidoglycan-binding domain-containing protein [Williamsia sp.]|nr:LysM peptidoglycan-binding domain-containing protein [Williamsia sp.]